MSARKIICWKKGGFKQRLKCIWEKIRYVGAFIRMWLEEIRKKNPQIFDVAVRCVEVAWFVLSTFVVAATPNIICMVIFMCIAFLFLYFAQWALLTNKRDRVVEEVQLAEAKKRYDLEEEKNAQIEQLTNEKEAECARLKKQKTTDIQKVKRLSLKAVSFTHTVAHNIKIKSARMPHQSMQVTREILAEFMVEALNTFEDVLTEYYQQNICASVKLCVSEDYLKTYFRGQNNIENRGGKSKVKNLNKTLISIDDNYAYRAIVRRQLQYFAEGDLRNLHEKEENTDEFFCEYGERWADLFQASIVIPIRYPVMNGSVTQQYKMLGIICVDAKKAIPEWSQPQYSYAYQLTAFMADALYSLLDQYEKEQISEKNKLERQSFISQITKRN